MGLVLFPLLVFSPIERVANQYYQLKRKPIPISVISLSASFVGIAVSFYCIVYLQLGYLSWFISAFISNFISSSAYIYLMTVKHKFIPIFRFNISTFKRYLRIGLPVVPHQYASYLLNSSDRVVMDVMSVNNADLGKYNFAYTFGNMSQQMAQGVTTASRPYYMSILAGNKPDKLIEFRKLTFFLLKVFIAITFIGCLWLKEIFGILVNNDELRAMYPLAIIIIMSYNFTPMYQNASLVLSYNENTNALWKISLTAGILNVLLNFIFIPIYGYKVAAITTFATLLFLGFRGNFMKKYKEDQPLKNYSSAWIVALAGSTLLVYLLRDIHFSWKIGVSIIILIGLVLMYKRKYSNVFTSKLIG